MFLLDTNVTSELRKPRPHGAVVAWLQFAVNAILPIDGRAFRCWAQLMHRRSESLCWA